MHHSRSIAAMLATCLLLNVAVAARPTKTPPPPQITVFVSDMHCGSCAKKIASKLYTVKGVLKVRTNVEKNVAIVVPAKGKKISPKALWEAVEAVKFKPVKIVTPQLTYKVKPKR